MHKQLVTICGLLVITAGLLAGCVFTISLSPNMRVEIDPVAIEATNTPTPVLPPNTPTSTPAVPISQPNLPSDFAGIDLLPLEQSLPVHTTFYSMTVAAPHVGGYPSLADTLLITDVEPSVDQFILAAAHVYSGSLQSAFTSTQPVDWVLFLNEDEKDRWGDDAQWENGDPWLHFVHLAYNDPANLLTTQSIIMSDTLFLQADNLSEGVTALETSINAWKAQHTGLDLRVDFVVIDQPTKGKRLYTFYYNPNDPSGGSSVRCRQWFACDTAQGGWKNFCTYVLRCE